MATKQWKAIKNLSKVELTAKERELEAALFQTKMKKVTGQLSDTTQTWRLRKEMARVKTLQTQMAAKSEAKGK